MKIGPFDTKTITSASTGAAAGDKRTSGADARVGGAEPSARLALSPALAGGGIDAGGGVFDEAKVRRISEAIRRGDYVIDAEAIAERLLVNARELLGNGPGGPAAPAHA